MPSFRSSGTECGEVQGIMGTLVIGLVSVIVLVFVIRFSVGRLRGRELDRDFTFELSCTVERALGAAANAARGVLWEVDFTDNGLRTRHIKVRNVIHVAISDTGRPGRCTAKVWTRYAVADGGILPRPRSFTDTRRKRDKILRALAAYQVPARQPQVR